MSARGRKRIHVTEWRPETNEWYEHAIPTDRSSKGGAVVLAVIIGSVVGLGMGLFFAAVLFRTAIAAGGLR